MLIYRFNKEMAQIELYHNTDDDEPYEVIELDTAVWLYKNIVRCKECERRKKNGFCLEHNRYEKNDNGYCSYGEREGE